MSSSSGNHKASNHKNAGAGSVDKNQNNQQPSSSSVGSSNVNPSAASSSESKKKIGLISSLRNSSLLPSSSSSGSAAVGSSSKDAAKRAQEEIKESELLKKKHAKLPITVEDVQRLGRYTDNYLCDLADNIYAIEFVRFKIRDVDTDLTLFEVAKSESDSQQQQQQQQSQVEDDSSRFVRYNFSSAFLRLKTVGATVEFTVGDKPVKNFCMIERHYFDERLLKSFDFDFGFCVPNSRNTIEHIYQFPRLTDSQMDEMISNPYATRSDTFYFVDNKLIMHNKADYAYNADYI